MATTATIKTFQAGDSTDAKTQMEALAPASGDWVISWQQSNQVYVSKIHTA